jgi:uncharacterized protein (DUF1015 family)
MRKFTPSKPVYQMTILPFRALYLDAAAGLSDNDFFLAVKSDYHTFQQQQLFRAYPESSLFVYQIVQGQQLRTGIIGCIPVTHYEDGFVLRHELTIESKEAVQRRLSLERGAVVKPILLTYPGYPMLDDWLQTYVATHEPAWEVAVAELQEAHRFFPLSQEADIAYLQTLFTEGLQHAYIADGHHRFSSAVSLYRQQQGLAAQSAYEHLMCAFFPADALEIHNFNRVVYNALESISPASFMAELSQYASLTRLPAATMPAAAHELTMLLAGEWFSVSWRDLTWFTRPDRSVSTDVDLFNDLILHRILGIEDVRTDKKIDYIEGPKGIAGLEEAVAAHPGSIGFCLYPLDWQTFQAIIDAGQVLPPKSTWFEPRMKNGLLIQPYFTIEKAN